MTFLRLNEILEVREVRLQDRQPLLRNPIRVPVPIRVPIPDAVPVPVLAPDAGYQHRVPVAIICDVPVKISQYYFYLCP